MTRFATVAATLLLTIATASTALLAATSPALAQTGFL